MKVQVLIGRKTSKCHFTTNTVQPAHHWTNQSQLWQPVDLHTQSELHPNGRPCPFSNIPYMVGGHALRTLNFPLLSLYRLIVGPLVLRFIWSNQQRFCSQWPLEPLQHCIWAQSSAPFPC